MSVETTRKRLTQKQTLFCLHYFSSGHATNSAIAAGYSPLYARENAPKILQLTTVQDELARLNAPLEADARHTKAHKLDLLARIANHEPWPEEISARDRILALAEHSKIMGDYALAPKHRAATKVVFDIHFGQRVRVLDVVDGEFTEEEE